MVAIDDTLHLHAVADDIDWNFNEPRLAGVRMPIDKWPTSTTPTGHAVLAVWALKPWGALSTPPMPIEIRDPLGLADGDTVSFWVMGSRDSTDFGELQPHGDGVVDGGIIRSTTGLGFVTWLFVAQSE